MFRLSRACPIFLFALVAAGVIDATKAQDVSSASGTVVTLRWVARPGVSRYRVQIARDLAFKDIVDDRVVNGNQIQIDDLEEGCYFWRVAAIRRTRGKFSSPSTIYARKIENPSPISNSALGARSEFP